MKKITGIGFTLFEFDLNRYEFNICFMIFSWETRKRCGIIHSKGVLMFRTNKFPDNEKRNTRLWIFGIKSIKK